MFPKNRHKNLFYITISAVPDSSHGHTHTQSPAMRTQLIGRIAAEPSSLVASGASTWDDDTFFSFFFVFLFRVFVGAGVLLNFFLISFKKLIWQPLCIWFACDVVVAYLFGCVATVTAAKMTITMTTTTTAMMTMTVAATYERTNCFQSNYYKSFSSVTCTSVTSWIVYRIVVAARCFAHDEPTTKEKELEIGQDT